MGVGVVFARAVVLVAGGRGVERGQISRARLRNRGAGPDSLSLMNTEAVMCMALTNTSPSRTPLSATSRSTSYGSRRSPAGLGTSIHSSLVRVSFIPSMLKTHRPGCNGPCLPRQRRLQLPVRPVHNLSCEIGRQTLTRGEQGLERADSQKYLTDCPTGGVPLLACPAVKLQCHSSP